MQVGYLSFHYWLHALVQVRKQLSRYYRCGVICLRLGAGSGSEFMYLSCASLYRFVLSVPCHALKMLVKELSQVGVCVCTGAGGVCCSSLYYFWLYLRGFWSCVVGFFRGCWWCVLWH